MYLNAKATFERQDVVNGFTGRPQLAAPQHGKVFHHSIVTGTMPNEQVYAVERVAFLILVGLDSAIAHAGEAEHRIRSLVISQPRLVAT